MQSPNMGNLSLRFIPKWISGKDYNLAHMFQTSSNKLCGNSKAFSETLLGKALRNITFIQASTQQKHIKNLITKFLKLNNTGKAALNTCFKKFTSNLFPNDVFGHLSNFLDLQTCGRLGLSDHNQISVHLERLYKGQAHQKIINKNLLEIKNNIEKPYLGIPLANNHAIHWVFNDQGESFYPHLEFE